LNTRDAKWREIEGDIWTVPAGRHKESKEHIVPLWTFSTWATEQGYDRVLAEMALSHAVGGAVERAYQRSTRVNARRALIAAWADFAAA
jgi:integrase